MLPSYKPSSRAGDFDSQAYKDKAFVFGIKDTSNAGFNLAFVICIEHLIHASFRAVTKSRAESIEWRQAMEMARDTVQP
jgi:hypothetical protein